MRKLSMIIWRFSPSLSSHLLPIDVSTIDIGEDDVSPEQQEKMREIIRKYVDVFKDGGNALPPPALGVLCDVDVGDTPPIAQKARKVRPEFMEKLHILLKALLNQGLIQFSNSSWPLIVIVLKKNKKDI